MTMLAAIGLGLLIGLALGALGGGGSILTVPALVYVLGQPARAATTQSLVIVGVAAAFALAGHARAHHVRWKAGLAFGAVGILASYAGTAANRSVDPNLLLLAFAALILVTAVTMLIRQRAAAQRETELIGAGLLDGSAGDPRSSQIPSVDALDGPPDRPAGGIAVLTARPTMTRPKSSAGSSAVKILVAGLAVGFLTGFLGVGGGFVIVPVLVMALGYPMPVAVGTSLLVIAINSATALTARASTATFHWSLIIPFTAAAIAGSLAGKGVTERVTPKTLTTAFAVLLLAVAGYVTGRAGLSLSA